MTYTPLTWANGAMPALNGANLNHIEAGIAAAAATRGLIITDTSVSTIPAGTEADNLSAYLNSGASTITVAGVDLAAGTHAVWVWVAGAWVLLSTAAPVPDETAPTGGILTTTGTGYAGSTRTLTVSGATDETELHAQPYCFSTDAGSTWTNWQTPAAWGTPALAAGTYTPRAQVRDASGNAATLTTNNFTVADAPVLVFNDTFTAADNTDVIGRTVDGFTWFTHNNHSYFGFDQVSPIIVSNKATATVNYREAVLDVGIAMKRVSWTFSHPGGAGTIQVRGAIGTDGRAFWMYEPTRGFELYKTGTQVGSTYAGAGIGAQTDTIVTLEWDGTTISAAVNGVTFASTTDPSFTGTFLGIFLSAGTTIDNVTVEAL